jgi:membrane protease YdiL (CAAX protease family)
MPSTGATAAAHRWRDRTESYWTASRRPLAILVFLLPLVIAYEAGLAFVLRSREGVVTNKAHETLLDFFDTFGLTATGGLYLGGAAIVVVLLVWHLLAKAPWQVDPLTPALIVLGLLLAGGAAAASEPPGATDLASMSIPTRLAISIGAGLYEELLFRMMLIAVLHTLLVDVARLPSAHGTAIAVIVSAAAFTLYHPLRDSGGVLSGQRLVFYVLAGLYFGAVYTARGFGIVVGTHALYDVIVVCLLGGGR